MSSTKVSKGTKGVKGAKVTKTKATKVTKKSKKISKVLEELGDELAKEGQIEGDNKQSNGDDDYRNTSDQEDEKSKRTPLFTMPLRSHWRRCPDLFMNLLLN